MLKAQLSNIVIWAILWGATFGLFFLIFTSEDYVKRYIWVSAYYMVGAIFAFLVFKERLLKLLTDFTAQPLIILAVVAISQVAAHYYLPKCIKEPTEYFKRYPKRSYLNLSFKRLISKSIELITQQMFIILLTLFLSDAGLRLTQIVMVFALIFGVVHIPLIFIERWWTSWYFVALSFVASAVFPTLILKVRYGFVYGYIIHWVFYTFISIGFWIVYNYRHNLWPKQS